MGSDPSAALPPIKVDLPPPPSFAASDVPEENPDGSWTVRGVRKHKADNLQKVVKVHAFLLEVYVCPKCPKGRDVQSYAIGPTTSSATRPTRRRKKALMVVDYLRAQGQAAGVDRWSKQYDVDGTFSINSPTGFGASEGLLIAEKMTDDKGARSSPRPRGRRSSEQKALNGEAIEAALAKKREAAKNHK